MQQLPQRAARFHHRAEQAAIVGPGVLGIQDNRPRPVAEQDTRRAIFPVDHGAERIGADQQQPVVVAALDIAVGDGHAVHKTGARRIHIKGRDIVEPQASLEQTRG